MAHGASVIGHGAWAYDGTTYIDDKAYGTFSQTDPDGPELFQGTQEPARGPVAIPIVRGVSVWGKKTNSNALYGTCRVHGGGYNILYITKNGAESYEVYTTLDRGEPPRVIHR